MAEKEVPKSRDPLEFIAEYLAAYAQTKTPFGREKNYLGKNDCGAVSCNYHSTLG